MTSRDEYPTRFFLLLPDQREVELQRLSRSAGAAGCDYYLSIGDPAGAQVSCAPCQVLGAEVSRLLTVLDQKERELSTVCLSRPLTITMQRAQARIADLERALGDALRGWNTRVPPEEMGAAERLEYERLIEVYRRDRFSLAVAKEAER